MQKGLYFLAGAAIGSVVTWFCVKEYYRAEADEEIASVKENFRKEREADKNRQAVSDIKAVAEKAINKPDLTSYSDILKRARYYKHISSKPEENAAPIEKSDIPYCITPEKFVEINGYDKVTLTYFDDDEVLIKEELMDEDDISRVYPGDTVGDDFVDGIGKYESGVGYFRNDKVGADYEVIVDHRAYKDVYPDVDLNE